MREVLELTDLVAGDILVNKEGIPVVQVTGTGFQSFLGRQKATSEDEEFNSTEDKFAEVALYYLRKA